ncbi:MlaD family protein [Hydrogenimonas urashimensis]|uniref:MlaD family protein n=1 Tax=Hydrogenimonas urashimensis TaxID=2740515 RepID=UPI001916195D|nr:MlaD family protein [Hydrogenimonas urashimensis]
MKTEAKVGLFVTIGLILLFLLSTQVNKFQGVGKKGYEVEAIINDASGLEKHAKVKMKGVEVGYVKDIALSGTKVVVTLFIYKNAKIPADSEVLLTQESMLGSKYINIIPGSSHAYLGENGVISRQKPMSSFEEMGTSVTSAAEELKHFIHELRETLDKESRSRLKKTFANLEVLTRDMKEIVVKNRENMDKLIANINNAAEKFAKMSEKFSTSADTINADLPGLMAKLQETIDAYRGAGQTLDEKLPSLAEKFESLEDQLNDVIKENKKPLNDALTSVNTFFTKGESTMVKLNNYLDAVTQTRLELGMDAFYLAQDDNFKGGLHVDYMPYYSRHYMIDVISSPDYEKCSMENGECVYDGDKKHEKGNWYVSAQIGKRYRDFMVRGGIIESTAGAGIDYYAYHDRLKLSLDAYDFNAVNDIRGDNVHLRATARYRFYKFINAYIGYDNFLNSDADNIFFGLGIRFEDDRMKYLLGAGAGAGVSAAK